jgi:hypothetical protein
MLLLSNASATGSTATWPGGRGFFTLAGTVGGATIKIQLLGPDGTTFLDAVKLDGTTAASMTAVGCLELEMPPAQIKATVTGGSPSGLYARLERMPR